MKLSTFEFYLLLMAASGGRLVLPGPGFWVFVVILLMIFLPIIGIANWREKRRDARIAKERAMTPEEREAVAQKAAAAVRRAEAEQEERDRIALTWGWIRRTEKPQTIRRERIEPHF
jgi:hypothetical protein